MISNNADNMKHEGIVWDHLLDTLQYIAQTYHFNR